MCARRVPAVGRIALAGRSPRPVAPILLPPLVPGAASSVVYEACGFGFGLYRQLVAAGAQCYVIAPRKLDEERKGVKTDALDATTLGQRLSRYLDGNTAELAVIRVPSEEEERARQRSRQREQLVRHRKRLEAQGRGLLVSHGLPAPAHLLARPPASLVPSAASVERTDL